MKKLCLAFLLGLLLYACTDKMGDNLPPASGLTGDIYLVMDSAQWKGRLGKQIDAIFSADMNVINRSEPIFKMRWIDPRKLNSVLKQTRNLIFVATLDKNSVGARRVKNMFTPESIDKIKSDTSFFFTSTKNQFAKGQEVMFLVGATEEALIKKLKINSQRLVNHFDQAERERLRASLFKSGQQKGVNEIIKKRFGIDFKIPFGYELVIENKEFVWVRQFNSKDDRDIFITRKPYVSEAQFEKDSLISFRDATCKKYLFGNPEKPDSYLITEKGVPYKQVLAVNTTLQGNFAKELRGLWRTNSLSMGGPFISYTVVDQKQGMLYYLEGFAYAPAREQREILRELETILHTFRPAQ